MFLRKTENDVRVGSVSHSLLMLIVGSTASLTLAAGTARASPRAQSDLVEFEKMTWVEVKSALAAGKTTALIYTGGVEERGRIDSRYHRDHERAARCHARAHHGASDPQRFPQRDSDGRSRWRPAAGLRGGRQEAQRTLRSSPCVLL